MNKGKSMTSTRRLWQGLAIVVIRRRRDMSAIVKPFPVIYACQGCPQFGELAHEVGTLLDRNGVAEMVWLGAPDLKRKSRFPAVALDGCNKACARRWLERHGIAAERSYVLEERRPGSAERAVQRIAADLGNPS